MKLRFMKSSGKAFHVNLIGMWISLPKRENTKTVRLLISLVVDYLDHFDNDPAETYIKSDGTAAVELSFRFELDWG